MSILLQNVNVGSKFPTRGYDDDAGLDLYTLETTIIWPHQVKNISTGWKIKVPEGTWGSIKTRSSTFVKRKLLVLEGVIDPNYTGELSVVVFNPTLVPKIVRFNERLAQLLIIPICRYDVEETTHMPATNRGPFGFGQSGR